MANRYKPRLAKIESLQDADLVLKEIGLLERELEQVDAEAQKRIGEIKAEAVRTGEPLRERIAQLTSMLGAFAEYNKTDLFRERKTVELAFGCFGYRKSTSIHVRKTTVELLKKLKLERFVRIKEEADKEALGTLDDETLAQVEAVRKVKDEFFCEPNREEVNKELLREQIA